jgi:hypothetical protein
MSTMNIAAEYQTNNIYASNGYHTSVSWRPTSTSLLGIGAQFENTHAVAYARTSTQNLPSSPSVSTVDSRSLSVGVRTRSSTDPAVHNLGERRVTGSTARGRSDYVHTTRDLESDLRSISTPSPGRIDTPQSAVCPPPYRNVCDTRSQDFCTGQRLPAYASQTPGADSRLGSLASGYSQMGRWQGETADQRPWDGVVAVSAMSGHQNYANWLHPPNSEHNSTRNGGSSDF